MKVNPRRITAEELELLALRWARSQPGRILNNINVDCFMAGYTAAHDVLYHQFAEFLMDEGVFYEHEYVSRRMETLGNSNLPLNPKHAEEFEQAQKFGRLLFELGVMYQANKLLP